MFNLLEIKAGQVCPAVRRLSGDIADLKPKNLVSRKKLKVLIHRSLSKDKIIS